MLTSHSKGQITVGFCSCVAYFNQQLFAHYYGVEAVEFLQMGKSQIIFLCGQALKIYF
jgi:hypothetical protein